MSRYIVLVTAAAKGDLDLLVHTLDGEYGEVGEEDIKEAMLRSACHGNKDCLARLLTHTSADPNCEDIDGDTPLMLASSNDHVEVVKLLLESGCDVDLRSERNRTALHMAVWNQRNRIIKLLLRAGCDVDVRDRYGDTPLMLSARRGYPEIMMMLLKSGCDVNKLSHENETALHYAARHGHVECVKLLLDQAAQLDLDKRTIWGFSPLALATIGGYTEVALTLIGAGADIHARDRSEKTILHHAVKKNLPVVVEWLLELGADVDTIDADGNSPLYEALTGGPDMAHMVRLIVRFGAQVKVVGRATLNGLYCWCSPLEFAVHTGNLSAARLLYATGCEFVEFLKVLDLAQICTTPVRDWARETLGRPRRLMDIARIVIRKQLGVHLKEMVVRLPLPRSIQMFVSCAHDDEFEDCRGAVGGGLWGVVAKMS